jgi:hypothetical protein
MMNNSKVHINGIIGDNRLLWKKLITGLQGGPRILIFSAFRCEGPLADLDFHVGVEVFPSNIITNNEVSWNYDKLDLWTCIHGYEVTWYMYTRIQGYLYTWIHGYMNTRIPVYEYTCIHGYMDS